MYRRLIECPEGATVKLVKIEAGKNAVLNLINLGFNLGDSVKVSRKSLFKGPITVSSQGTEVAIGYGLAKKILVEN